MTTTYTYTDAIGAPNDFTSSAISVMWYDAPTKMLVVEFTSGHRVAYWNFPELTWEAFKCAESKGRFYSYYVKGNFNGSPADNYCMVRDGNKVPDFPDMPSETRDYRIEWTWRGQKMHDYTLNAESDVAAVAELEKRYSDLFDADDVAIVGVHGAWL